MVSCRWLQVGFLSRCLILLNDRVCRWSIFGVAVSENGTHPSRFVADCNGVAADRSSRVGSRESFRSRVEVSVQTQDSPPLGIHIELTGCRRSWDWPEAAFWAIAPRGSSAMRKLSGPAGQLPSRPLSDWNYPARSLHTERLCRFFRFSPTSLRFGAR